MRTSLAMAAPINLLHVLVEPRRITRYWNPHDSESKGGDHHEFLLPFHVEIPHNKCRKRNQQKIDQDVKSTNNVPEEGLDYR